MEKIKFILLTLLLSFVLVACGQGNNEVLEDEDHMGTNYENEQQDPETMPDDEKQNEEENETESFELINLYFSNNQLENTYRVEVPVDIAKNEEGIKDALELWAAGPVEEGLHGLVPEEIVTVQSVEDVDGVAHVSFSSDLLEANVGSAGEGMLIEQIVMIVAQFGYDEVLILIDGEVNENFLGHVGLPEPIPASSPDDYQLYQP